MIDAGDSFNHETTKRTESKIKTFSSFNILLADFLQRVFSA